MAQYDINLREYWRILRKRKFIVILIAIVLGVFSTSFAVLRAPVPLYTTACIIEFEQTPSVEGLYGSAAPDPDSEVETQITVIKSYPVFQRVAEKLRLIPPGAFKEGGQPEENVIPIIEGLQSKVEVSRDKWSFILSIQVTDTNPAFAQKLANTIAYTYRELHREEQMKRSKETLKYISEQLGEVRARLRKSEDEFNRFTQDNELISIDLQSENLLARVQEIQGEIRMLREDKGELQELLARLNGFIEDPSGSGHDFYSSTANTQYQSTYDKLVGLLLKKDTLLKSFTLKHPEVQAISYEIIENARKMVILLQLQISGLEKKEVDLGEELGKVEKKTKVLMDKKLEFNRLKRKVDLYTDMAALLEKKNQEALIRRAERPEEVKIVKPALLPAEPINPPKTLATGAAGVLVGVILGLVIGFVVETFDTSLGAIEDVEETLGTQVLGIVPQADIKDMIEGLKEKYPEGISLPEESRMSYLVSHFVPKSMMSESFRALRTNVQFKDAEKRTKAIAVTSSSPQEGKTLVTINLAIAMAQARVKVLLVGSDLRKPTVDKVFDVEMTPGLTDILMENYQWRDTVKTVMDMAMGEMTQTQIIRTPGLDNLHIITSGPIPPNPAELIDSKALTDFMEEAKEEYDMILFDSPPILSTADAAILGSKVDGVLLVYRVGSVSRGLLKRSMTQLEQVKANILGVILNGMRPEVSPDFQDYKYYSYYYSYGEEGKDKKRRDQRKGWAFLGRKGEKERKASIGEKGGGPEEKEAKKASRGRLLLLLLAAVLLAVGVLWHNGLIDPFKALEKQGPVRKDEIRADTQKDVPKKRAIKRKTKIASVKQEPSISKKESRHRAGESVPKSPAVSKNVADIEAPLMKKETLKSGLPKGREAVSHKPKPMTSIDKPAAMSIIPEKEAVGETSATEKPEPFSEKQKSPSVVEKPEPPKVASIPESQPVTKNKAVTKTTPSPRIAVSYPYSLYLGSFKALERARKAVSHYGEKGLSAYWVKVLLSKGTWYRVYAGYFEDSEKGERFREEKGLEEATVEETPYTTLIGVFSSANELEDKIRSLRRLGYGPYVIKDSEGKFRICVGAFYPEHRAQRQYKELKSSGVQSQVVKR